MKYRADIGGLRALAIVSVVLFHFKVPGFSGGFSGVDIFFVISGYLMSCIFLTKVDLGIAGVFSFY
ncbi:acyltransferase family protein, partial [Enterobacter sp.]|uniref:acyltransferase family protein n=1 Tax=Enterobacter sp. TaxID=42895 RepID=UPI0037842DFD